LGDGILNLEFQSKMNTIEVMFWLLSIKRSICPEYQGLVIGNQAANFSVGQYRNDFMMAVEQEYDELNMAIKCSKTR
jgi:3-hydroxyacyl-CoA dehydrogenase